MAATIRAIITVYKFTFSSNLCKIPMLPHVTSSTRSLAFSSSLHNQGQLNVEEGLSEASEESVSDTTIRPAVDVHTSISYLQSKAYQVTYGNALVWEPYRRNFKGQQPPQKTRKTCVRKGVISTGNPCPICRDDHLVLHPDNVKLLKQFISPYTGKVLSYEKTGLCQRQHKNLLVAVQQAWDLGLIDMPLPFRQYNYHEFYPLKSSLRNE